MHLYLWGNFIWEMTYNFDIIAKIKSLESTLKPSEKKVCRLILEDLQWAGSASIYELAESAGVSQTTVTRFAKVVGCKNVRDLKAQLVSSFAIGRRFIDGHSEKISQNSFGYIIQEIQDTLTNVSGQMSERSMKKASSLINNCNKLVVFGSGGGSSIVSQDAQYRLFRLGISVTAHQDTIIQRMTAATLDSDSVVLVISTSGEMPEINDNVSIAKQYGAQIIAITRSNTTLSNLSDIHLQVHVHESEDIFKPTASRYALLAAVDAIALEVANMRQDKCKEILRKIKYNLDSKTGKDQRFPLGD